MWHPRLLPRQLVGSLSYRRLAARLAASERTRRPHSFVRSLVLAQCCSRGSCRAAPAPYSPPACRSSSPNLAFPQSSFLHRSSSLGCSHEPAQRCSRASCRTAPAPRSSPACLSRSSSFRRRSRLPLVAGTASHDPRLRFFLQPVPPKTSQWTLSPLLQTPRKRPAAQAVIDIVGPGPATLPCLGPLRTAGSLARFCRLKDCVLQDRK